MSANHRENLSHDAGDKPQEGCQNPVWMSSFHTQWKLDFDSYALKTPEGVVFVDPMKPSPEVVEKLEAWGVRWRSSDQREPRP